MGNNNKPKNSLGSKILGSLSRAFKSDFAEDIKKEKEDIVAIETATPEENAKNIIPDEKAALVNNIAPIAPIYKSATSAPVKKWIKVGVELQPDIIEKIDSYAYWERKKKKDVIHEALAMYFKDKDVKKKPS